ncbi:MAG: copper transporter [Acidimicrobiales bacterium]
MINLRYHVVSLVAVFLALTVGIVMGSTVIDRVTVDALNQRVTSVSKSVSNVQAENERLKAQVSTLQGFADQARDQIAQGRLKGVPVLVVSITGIDRKPVDGLRQALASSQAAMAGTVWFTTKMRVAGDADARALAAALNVAVDRPDALRRLALTRLAAAAEGTPDVNPLPALVSAGFAAWDPPPAPASTSTTAAGATSTSTAPPVAGTLPAAGVRVVLVSGAGADVGDDEVAVPLAQVLGQSSSRLVAAESGQDTPGGRAVFVGLLRNDATLSARVSTVDDLESPSGQAATVLALEDLAVPRTGDYGVGPGATRQLPATST